jgi:hypothetical protein
VPSGYEDCLDDWIDFPARPIVQKNVIEEACRIFLTIATSKSNTRLLARSNKAAAEFASTSFSDCVLACWLQIETYLYNKLVEYMDSCGSTKFNVRRKKKLLLSTSSQVIELLEVSGNLTKDIYDLLTKVRKVRNEIVHSDYSATVSEASEALNLLERVIEDISGEKISLNSGISMNLF